MKALRLLLSVAVLDLVLSAAASAAPHGILWARGQRPARFGPAAAGSNLLYYGGPVIQHAKVYAVFWGDNVDATTKAKIGPFFANILDSTYMDWLSIYNTDLTAVDGRQGTKQKIGRGTFGGGFTIKPANTSKNLTDAQVQEELQSQIAAGSLPAADDDSLYMTYFPSGVSITIEGMRSCQAFCAYHEGFKSKAGANIFYGVMPVCGGFGCGMGGSAFDTLSSVSSHEAIEAVTDPFPTPGDKPAYPQAWNTVGGEEISDLCAGKDSTVTGHGITSVVTQNWDNRISACLKGPWTQSAPEQDASALSRRLPLAWSKSWTAPRW